MRSDGTDANSRTRPPGGDPAEPPTEGLNPFTTALFLDFDGTLAEVAERPDRVRVPERVTETLHKLQWQLGGALAIVTGRDIPAIDGFLEPLRLPISGVHGLVRRDVEGGMHDTRVNLGLAQMLSQRLRPFVEAHDGLVLERKTGSVVLHYRQRPDLEGLCRRTMDAIVEGVSGARLLHGKMVIEAMAEGASKGQGIAEFLREAPFRGRTPVFAGDDVTDEDAFEEVNDRDGMSIKVGEGETVAHYRLDSPADVHAWLDRLSATFETHEALVGGA